MNNENLKKKVYKAIETVVESGKMVNVATVRKALYPKKTLEQLLNEKGLEFQRELKLCVDDWKNDQKELKKIEGEKNQRPVKSMTINVEWKKSATWGGNPHATARVEYKDGGYDTFTATCSGCGYDKLSTVVGDICNQTLKYLLWGMSKTKAEKKPYGVTIGKDYCYFGQGVGMSCYEGERGVIAFLGGKITKTGWTDSYDGYLIEFK